jgi:hypothetical protein
MKPPPMKKPSGGPEPRFFTGGSKEAGRVNVQRARQTLARRELFYHPHSADGERARRMVDAPIAAADAPSVVGASSPFLVYGSVGANLSASWYCFMLACRYTAAACRCAIVGGAWHRGGNPRYATNGDKYGHVHGKSHPDTNIYPDANAHQHAESNAHPDGNLDTNGDMDAEPDVHAELHADTCSNTHPDAYSPKNSVARHASRAGGPDRAGSAGETIGCDGDGRCDDFGNCGLCDYRAEVAASGD